jgi:hypothetical protein
MTDVAAVKVLDGFKNQLSFATLEYDFANDGGSTGALVLATTAGDLIVHSALVYVVTTCTSGGSATVIMGSSSTDTDAFMDLTSGAVASLTANSVIYETTQQCYIPDAQTITMTIGTATLTAGKLHLKLIYEMI